MADSVDRPGLRRFRLISLILASVVVLVGGAYAVERLYLAPLREALGRFASIRRCPP